MAGFGGYNEKKKKKAKQGSSSASAQSSFSSKPVFVMPKMIEKIRKEK